METKTKVETDGSLVFEKIMSLPEKLMYLLLLFDQCQITLREMRLSKQLLEDNERMGWIKQMKKQLKKNAITTDLVIEEAPYNELILKVKL